MTDTSSSHHGAPGRRWQLDTALAHLGRASAVAAKSVNPPIVRASTTVFESLAEFKASYQGTVFEAPRYGRSGTSTNFELQAAMAGLCGAQTCIATPSGLSAIAAVLGAHARPGCQILVQENVYGPTQTLCEKVLGPLQCRIDYFGSADALEEKLTAQAALIFLEVPSSLTMQMVDVAAVCEIARRQGVPVACDSTWGTPVFFDAHALGIDISLHAATKYINGHSDTLLGLLTGSYEALQSTRAWCDRHGTHVSADSCALALRGMRTLGLRMARHDASALAVASWLQAQPQIARVLFPALPSDPGHALWKQQFTGGPGPFTVELTPCSEPAYERFIDALRLFGLGTSWGGFESLVMPAIPHHLRALAVQPDDGRLVRFHIGLEAPEDLCSDLHEALRHVHR
ncbi:PLP-dependent aspartate aminotransferase family protein [Acidovorax sp. GBBC 3334]|uniref:trans-sulfuration enzyme family protein n=1 Tax=Acidovorax sp. GBBC 3334 TaxID=2940496 RepID=UPI0023024544|nr:PLP-dependent aspartate aminotransferase family protein [Acidovorax sp. GBBC 3334]MDA8455657.1 PLP-dependent aspartate aminotransferase family protein [Acidovorax sp. GBBC 3334]